MNSIIIVNLLLATSRGGSGFWNSFVSFLGSIIQFIYKIFPNYGVAIVLFTLLMRFALLPLDLKSKSATKKINDIQPELNEINEKYKNDPEKRNKKTMELYQKNKINPMGGCLPLLIQMPVFFALFAALRQISDLHIQKQSVESFLWIKNIWAPDSPMIDIYNKPVTFPSANWNGLFILPILAGITSYYQMKMTNPQQPDKDNNKMGGFNTIFPLMSVWFCSMYTAAFAIYWVTSNLFQIIQQWIFNRKNDKKKDSDKEISTTLKEGADK